MNVFCHRRFRRRLVALVAFVTWGSTAALASAQCPGDSTLGEGWGDVPSLITNWSFAIHDDAGGRTLVLNLDRSASAWLLHELPDGPCGMWSTLAIGGIPPQPRFTASFCFEAARRRILVFGGRALPGNAGLGDLWALDLTGTPAWSKIVTTGPGPSPRASASLGVDSAHDQLVLFGGGAGDSLWVLPLAGPAVWARYAASGDWPARRSVAAFVYDPTRERMLMYGGRINGTATVTDSVWALSTAGPPAWTRLTPSGPRPGPHASPAVAFDTANDRMLTTGGYAADGRTWGLSFTPTPHWTELATSGPRPGAACAGWVTGTPPQFVVALSPSEADMDGSLAMMAMSLDASPTWTWMGPAASPSWNLFVQSWQVDGAVSAVVDPVLDRLVAHDGSLVTIPLANPSQVARGGASPGTGRPAIYDPRRRRAVSWTGDATLAVEPLDGPPIWSSIPTVGTRPGFYLYRPAPYVLDARRDRLIVLGSEYTVADTTLYRSEVWALSLANPPTWTLLHADSAGAGLPPRSGANLACDPVGDRLIVHGGVVAGRRSNDVWEFPLETASG